MRKVSFFIIYVLLFVVISHANAQQDGVTWEEFVERMMNEEESGVMDEDRSADWQEEMFEELWELHCNPMNINTASEEELLVLPFLTEEQAREILYYRKVNGDLLSLGELIAIRSLDAETREWIRLFCYAAPKEKTKASLDNLLKYADHELTMRSDIPLYRKAGYKDVADSILEKSPNKVYRGSKYYHSLRYRLSSMNRLDIGLQMEKDPGERGVDYLSGYAVLKDMGWLKTLALGNYRVSFGQGLVVNTGTSFGKLMTLNSLGRMDRGIYRHSSTSETGYFSGAATTVELTRILRMSAFVSSRKEDGTMTKDSSGISSLKTDGLHRTHLEHSKKGNVRTTTTGGNIHLGIGDFDVSLTGVYTHYSIPLRPKHDTPASLYRYFNAQGSDFAAYSVAYAYALPSLSFRGETATSSSGGCATINSLQWQAGGQHRLTAIHRYYSADYVAVNGHSFGENDKPQNEHGLYLGWTTTMIPNTTMETYADIVYFPWRKYQVSSDSYGVDGMVQLTHRASKSVSLSARYKFKSKQKDFSVSETRKQLVHHCSHSTRLQCNISVSPSLSLRTTISGILKTIQTETSAKGMLVNQHIGWQEEGRGIRTALDVTYFNTDGYDSRISIYEPSLLHTFGFRQLYDHGIRSSALLSLPLCKQHILRARFGSTYYFNRHSIGTGLELISHKHREDIQVQLHARF